MNAIKERSASRSLSSMNSCSSSIRLSLFRYATHNAKHGTAILRYGGEVCDSVADHVIHGDIGAHVVREFRKGIHLAIDTANHARITPKRVVAECFLARESALGKTRQRIGVHKEIRRMSVNRAKPSRKVETNSIITCVPEHRPTCSWPSSFRRESESVSRERSPCRPRRSGRSRVSRAARSGSPSGAGTRCSQSPCTTLHRSLIHPPRSSWGGPCWSRSPRSCRSPPASSSSAGRRTPPPSPRGSRATRPPSSPSPCS